MIDYVNKKRKNNMGTTTWEQQLKGNIMCGEGI